VDTSILIPTLAKKYGFDISSPDKVMNLFNGLCTLQEEALHYKKVYSEAYEELVGLRKEVSEKVLAEKIILELNRADYWKVREECHKALEKYKVKIDLITGFVYPELDTEINTDAEPAEANVSN